MQQITNSIVWVGNTITNSIVWVANTILTVFDTLIHGFLFLLNLLMKVFFGIISMPHTKLRMIFTFIVIGLAHNLILINEEVLVAFCFITAVRFLKSHLGFSKYYREIPWMKFPE